MRLPRRERGAVIMSGTNHVELPEHEILHAEDVACKSYANPIWEPAIAAPLKPCVLDCSKENHAA